MEQWNILATAQRRQERFLLHRLNKFGDFRHSGCRDVILGNVADVLVFLDALESIRQVNSRKLRSLGQIVPIEKNFHFDVTNFREKAKEAVSPYTDQLENSKFFVRVVRRGHKGEISGMEMEKELDSFILESLERKGKHATVNIEEFEKMIVVETVENLVGIGLITREMKDKYPFIKIK
ncbi:MAG TPA: THUMP domain-containing protein [Dissulfurispiraceae bacterium]|nr:THUMP domain-containing protein [Dissulfurispiraceae bacterium]